MREMSALSLEGGPGPSCPFFEPGRAGPGLCGKAPLKGITGPRGTIARLGVPVVLQGGPRGAPRKVHWVNMGQGRWGRRACCPHCWGSKPGRSGGGTASGRSDSPGGAGAISNDCAGGGPGGKRRGPLCTIPVVPGPSRACCPRWSLSRVTDAGPTPAGGGRALPPGWAGGWGRKERENQIKCLTNRMNPVSSQAGSHLSAFYFLNFPSP